MNIQENLSQITVDIVGGGPRQALDCHLGRDRGGGGGEDENQGH